jgi:hypothetical protein
MQYLYIRIELNILYDRYTEELKKIHGPELKDPRSVHFNIDVAYATDGGTQHGRYMWMYQLSYVKYC